MHSDAKNGLMRKYLPLPFNATSLPMADFTWQLNADHCWYYWWACLVMCLESKRLQRYKTWTLDHGLDRGLDCGLDYGLDFGLDSVSILPFKEVHIPCIVQSMFQSSPCSSPEFRVQVLYLPLSLKLYSLPSFIHGHLILQGTSTSPCLILLTKLCGLYELS